MPQNLQGILPNKCLQPIPEQEIKMRTAYVFPEIAAGESDDTGTLLTIPYETLANTHNPVVIVSQILTPNDTFNPDLQCFGYLINNGSGNDWTLVIGVRNNGTEAITPPDIAAIVL